MASRLIPPPSSIYDEEPWWKTARVKGEGPPEYAPVDAGPSTADTQHAIQRAYNQMLERQSRRQLDRHAVIQYLYDKAEQDRKAREIQKPRGMEIPGTDTELMQKPYLDRRRAAAPNMLENAFSPYAQTGEMLLGMSKRALAATDAYLKENPEVISQMASGTGPGGAMMGVLRGAGRGFVPFLGKLPKEFDWQLVKDDLMGADQMARAMYRGHTIDVRQIAKEVPSGQPQEHHMRYHLMVDGGQYPKDIENFTFPSIGAVNSSIQQIFGPKPVAPVKFAGRNLEDVPLFTLTDDLLSKDIMGKARFPKGHTFSGGFLKSLGYSLPETGEPPSPQNRYWAETAPLTERLIDRIKAKLEANPGYLSKDIPPTPTAKDRLSAEYLYKRGAEEVRRDRMDTEMPPLPPWHTNSAILRQRILAPRDIVNQYNFTGRLPEAWSVLPYADSYRGPSSPELLHLRRRYREGATDEALRRMSLP